MSKALIPVMTCKSWENSDKLKAKYKGGILRDSVVWNVHDMSIHRDTK